MCSGPPLALALSHSLSTDQPCRKCRVYAAITRLQTGVLSQQSVMDRSRQCLGNQMPKTTRSQPDDTALENRVATVEGRLQKLENEGKNATLHIKPVEY
jgi:hypothetical protein